MKRAMFLLEAQVALCVLLSIALLVANMFLGLSKIKYAKSDLNLLVGLYQLADDLNVCYDLEIKEDYIVGHINPSNSFEVSLNNHRLVRTPGFNIYIHNLEEVKFKEIDDYLYIYLKDDGQYYEYKLIYTKRK